MGHRSVPLLPVLQGPRGRRLQRPLVVAAVSFSSPVTDAWPLAQRVQAAVPSGAAAKGSVSAAAADPASTVLPSGKASSGPMGPCADGSPRPTPAAGCPPYVRCPAAQMAGTAGCMRPGRGSRSAVDARTCRRMQADSRLRPEREGRRHRFSNGSKPGRARPGGGVERRRSGPGALRRAVPNEASVLKAV